MLVIGVVLLLSADGATQGQPGAVAPGQQVMFDATAYCDSGTTKSGVRTRAGIVAADPDLLPVGSVLGVVHPDAPRYDGVYTVMDTGSAVQGRKIDLFVRDCDEAKEFGVKRVAVRVVRLGWNPKASLPTALPR